VASPVAAGEELTLCPYTLTPAGGTISCGPWSIDVHLQPKCLNNLGSWAGYHQMCADDGTGQVAVYWTKESGLQTVPFSTATNSSKAFGMNDIGTVVGEHSTHIDGNGENWGFIFRNGIVIDVPPYPGSDGGTHALAVNNSDTVVGLRSVPVGPPYNMGFVWHDGQIEDIDPLMFGHLRAEARSVSDSGFVAGFFGAEGSATSRAFRWKEGQTEQLALPTAAVASMAYGVNNLGQVAGRCRFVNSSALGYRLEPTIWNAQGVPISLPIMPEYVSGTAVALNDAGVVIGYMSEPLQSGMATTRKAVWIDGEVHYLAEGLDLPNANSFGETMAVNQQGQFLTVGPYESTTLGAWLLTPTRPEADLDGDCKVDGADLALLLAAWGPADEQSRADLQRDGSINGADLGALLGAWTVN
jgi:uncharacterized membrane protein